MKFANLFKLNSWKYVLRRAIPDPRTLPYFHFKKGILHTPPCVGDDPRTQAAGRKRYVPVHVLMTPDFRKDNPYQTLLAKQLREHGVAVTFAGDPRQLMRLLSPWGGQLGSLSHFHIHWLTPFIYGRGLASSVVRALLFIGLLLWLKILRRKVIWTVHNLFSHDCNYPRYERLLGIFTAWAADSIVSLNASSLPQLAALFCQPPEKFCVVEHGNFKEMFLSLPSPGEARSAISVNARGTVYLHFGRLCPYKGTLSLLKAWSVHVRKYADDLLLIAGEGDTAYMQDLKAALPVVRVTLVDRRVSDDEIPHYFQAADVVVLPFVQTLNSGSVLLAMSFAKPIIAPAFPSLAEYLDGAQDLLYTPGDQNALVLALERAKACYLEDLAFRTKARCSDFDWSKLGDKAASIYT